MIHHLKVSSVSVESHVEGGGSVCQRTVIEGDALRVLRGTNKEDHETVEEDVEGDHEIRNLVWTQESSVVTSIPDVCEMSMPVEQWKRWFERAAYLIMRRTHPSQVAIFYQTDIKVEGRWIDKAFLVQKAAERASSHLLWHKVVMITKPNEVKFGRPGYSHMLCFSKERLDDIAFSTADVIDRGDMTWPKAMGLKACVLAVRYIKRFVAGCTTVVDPFCGKGSVLAVANEFGLNSLGVEISTKRSREALLLRTNTLEGEKDGRKRQRQQHPGIEPGEQGRKRENDEERGEEVAEEGENQAEKQEDAKGS